ncbi:MAG: hypothetical protein ACLR4Z_01110 [Butyricicoccaceae bacterium]
MLDAQFAKHSRENAVSRGTRRSSASFRRTPTRLTRAGFSVLTQDQRSVAVFRPSPAAAAINACAARTATSWN